MALLKRSLNSSIISYIKFSAEKCQDLEIFLHLQEGRKEAIRAMRLPPNRLLILCWALSATASGEDGGGLTDLGADPDGFSLLGEGLTSPETAEQHRSLEKEIAEAQAEFRKHASALKRTYAFTRNKMSTIRKSKLKLNMIAKARGLKHRPSPKRSRNDLGEAAGTEMAPPGVLAYQGSDEYGYEPIKKEFIWPGNRNPQVPIPDGLEKDMGLVKQQMAELRAFRPELGIWYGHESESVAYFCFSFSSNNLTV